MKNKEKKEMCDGNRVCNCNYTGRFRTGSYSTKTELAAWAFKAASSASGAVEETWREFLSRDHLQQEWNDCLSAGRVVFEFLSVVAVLATSPNGHLVEAGEREQASWKKNSWF